MILEQVRNSNNSNKRLDEIVKKVDEMIYKGNYTWSDSTLKQAIELLNYNR